MTTQKIIDNIQTRLENLVSERFSGSYQQIDISCSNYNPTIDTSITITITITDESGTPISGLTVPLKIDGTSISGVTTNSSGVATHTYTCTEWGTHRINVKSTSAQINVKGWKTIWSDSGIVIKVNGEFAVCTFNISSTPFPTTFSQFSGQIVPNGYRPDTPVVENCYNNNNVLVAVQPDGTIMRRSMTGSSITGACGGTLQWKY